MKQGRVAFGRQEEIVFGRPAPEGFTLGSNPSRISQVHK